MTICEFYREQFEKAKEQRHFNADSEWLAEKFGKGSYKWFKGMSRYYFGGGFLRRYTSAGITTHQLREAREKGFIKYVYDSSWQARQLGNQEWYGLTEKGLKALYNAFPDWN